MDPRPRDLALLAELEEGPREHVDVGDQHHVDLAIPLVVLGSFFVGSVLSELIVGGLARDAGRQDVRDASGDLLATGIHVGGAEGAQRPVHHVLGLNGPGLRAGSHQGREFHRRDVQLRDRPREGEQHVLELGGNGVRFAEGLFGAGGGVDEHEFLHLVEATHLGVGVVILPNDLALRKIDSQQPPKPTDIALGLLLAPAKHGVAHRTPRLAGGRHALREEG